ncbi:MAG: hypothetical protein CMH26_07545 [Micavibrio sp.]|nr:hypothetical protein [Micavibrio sp.]|tara:strand:- start:2019 stop:3137 length:1119 start_codon:yes stop_codon:yes gene_type:complete
MKCTICRNIITQDQKTKEHIIPNAIGGRKKIEGFICKNCNSETGRTWDAELTKQLNALCLICNISRERGSSPPISVETTAGDTVRYHAGGIVKKDRPYVFEEVDGQQVSLSIQARDESELKKILRQKKKKFPTLNIEEALSMLETESSFPQGMYKFSLNFGNELSMKAIVKSLLAVVFDAGVSVDNCDVAIQFLDQGGNIPVGYYYETDLIHNRRAGAPIHCVFVKGDKNAGNIVGYIELFGAYRMVSLLSSNYVGEDFSHSYAIDPISGKQETVQVNFTLDLEEILESYDYKKIPEGSMQEVFEQVIAYAQSRNYKLEREKVLLQAIDKGFRACGIDEGETPTEEQLKIISGIVFDELSPLLKHQISKASE